MTPDLPPGPAPAPTLRQATAREFLAVVFRRRLVILGLFFVTTATVLFIAFSTPLEYASSGRVLMRRGEKESILEASRQIVGGWEDELSSELQVVRSAQVRDREAEILAGRDSTRTAPAIAVKKVDAEVMGKSNVIAIGYSDRDPIVARRVCDAVIHAYIEFRSRDMALSYPRQFFESELAQVKGELDAKVEARRKYSDGAGVGDIAGERLHLLNRLTYLGDHHDDIAGELAEARTARERMVDLKTRENVDLPTFSSFFTNEGALVLIKSKVIEQQVRLAQLRERYRDDSPDIVAAQATLDTLRGMLDREVNARLAMSES